MIMPGFPDAKTVDHKVDMKEHSLGTACGVSLDGETHVIIVGTDAESLERALKELGIKKGERSKENVTVALFEASYDVDDDTKKRNPLEVVWVVHHESDCAFMSWVRDLDGDVVEIGPAIKKTALECKLLLRGLGWKRDDINNLEINDETDPDDEIPF